MKEPLTLVGAGVGIALLVFFFFSFFQEAEQPSVPNTPVRMTLSGLVTCLPHANTSGPQTLECAIGLQSDDGVYYALDLALLSQIPPPIDTGSRIRANGVFVPIEQLSSDHWEKYAIKGIFSVTDGVEVTR